jgi:hypothetical protein
LQPQHDIEDHSPENNEVNVEQITGVMQDIFLGFSNWYVLKTVNTDRKLQ